MHPLTIIFLFALALHLRRASLAGVAPDPARPGASRVPCRAEFSARQFRRTSTPRPRTTRSPTNASDASKRSYDAAVLLWLTLGGGIASVGATRSGTSALDGPWAGIAAGACGAFAALSLLGLPFGVYRTFVLEQRFGFNRTTLGVFVADLPERLGCSAPCSAAPSWPSCSGSCGRPGASWWIVALGRLARVLAARHAGPGRG